MDWGCTSLSCKNLLRIRVQLKQYIESPRLSNACRSVKNSITSRSEVFQPIKYFLGCRCWIENCLFLTALSCFKTFLIKNPGLIALAFIKVFYEMVLRLIIDSFHFLDILYDCFFHRKTS